MPRGIDVGLGPGDIVLDGNPAPPAEKGTAAPFPLFGPYLLWPNGHLSQLLLSSYCREYYHRGVESYFVSHMGPRSPKEREISPGRLVILVIIGPGLRKLSAGCYLLLTTIDSLSASGLTPWT